MQIDPNIRFHDGTENPNFGRVMVGSLSPSSGETHREFENHRLTGFFKFDASEKVDGWLGSLLGNHTVTGLVESHSSDTRSFSYRDLVFGDDYASFIGPRGNLVRRNDRQVATATYLGPSLANASSASGANLSNITQKLQIPSQATIRVFNRDTLLMEDHTFRIDGPIGLGGNLRKVEIDTKALVLHSRLLDEHIIGTFGWREDSYDVWSTTNPPTGLDGRRLLSPEEFKLPDEKAFSDSPQNTTWGVVAHIPDSIMENIAGGLGLSLHVSESDNSQVGQSRIDFNGNRLAPVSGTTEEYGFTFSALNDRLYLRANWYETSQLDDNSGLDGEFRQIIGLEANMIANIPDVIRYGFNTPPLAASSSRWLAMCMRIFNPGCSDEYPAGAKRQATKSRACPGDVYLNSLLYLKYKDERDEILRHKWLESEKAGTDIGFESAGKPGYWLGAVFMGLAWPGGVIIYGIGAACMGEYGAYAGFPMMILASILAGNLAGVVGGEWKDTSRQSRIVMVWGVLILFAAFALLGWSNQLLAEN